MARPRAGGRRHHPLPAAAGWIWVAASQARVAHAPLTPPAPQPLQLPVAARASVRCRRLPSSESPCAAAFAQPIAQPRPRLQASRPTVCVHSLLPVLGCSLGQRRHRQRPPARLPCQQSASAMPLPLLPSRAPAVSAAVLPQPRLACGRLARFCCPRRSLRWREPLLTLRKRRRDSPGLWRIPVSKATVTASGSESITAEWQVTWESQQ